MKTSIEINFLEKRKRLIFKIIGYFLIALSFSGLIFWIVYSIRNPYKWTNYFQIIFWLMIIFQTVFIISGQLIFKQYFIINDDGIKWQRTPLYDKKNLLWHHIKSIKVDYSIINFQLNNRCVKTSLSGLSKQKINELNEVLKKECKEKGISFETKWKEV